MFKGRLFNTFPNKPGCPAHGLQGFLMWTSKKFLVISEIKLNYCIGSEPNQMTLFFFCNKFAVLIPDIKKINQNKHIKI